jgi:hypothetical protein
VQPVDDVKNRRLSGAIRPDQRGNAVFLDVERASVDCVNTPERFGEIVNFQKRHWHLPYPGIK